MCLRPESVYTCVGTETGSETEHVRVCLSVHVSRTLTPEINNSAKNEEKAAGRHFIMNLCVVDLKASGV